MTNEIHISEHALHVDDIRKLTQQQVKDILSIIQPLLWTDAKRKEMSKKMSAKWTPEKREQMSKVMRELNG